MSPRKEEAMILAERTHKREEYVIQEALDQIELFEIYRSYWNEANRERGQYEPT